MRLMLTSFSVFYLLLAAVYLAIRIFSGRLSEHKLRSRSEIAIWTRDFFYKLYWVFLPLFLLPGIAWLVYFLVYEKLSGSEIAMYVALFLFYGFYVFKGIVKLQDLVKHIKMISEKPDYVRRMRSGDTAGEF